MWSSPSVSMPCHQGCEEVQKYHPRLKRLPQVAKILQFRLTSQTRREDDRLTRECACVEIDILSPYGAAHPTWPTVANQAIQLRNSYEGSTAFSLFILYVLRGSEHG